MDSDLDDSPHDFESTNVDKFKLRNFILNKNNTIDLKNSTMNVSKTCLTDNTKKTSSIVCSNTHVLVKWLEIDCGKTTVCHINQITNEEPNKIVERGVYLVRFSNKSKGGPYKAKVLAIGSKDQCTKIQTLFSNGSKSKIKTKICNEKPIKITDTDKMDSGKNKNSELQAVVDRKNIELENLKRDYELLDEKYNTLYQSLSKILKVQIQYYELNGL
jgi:hypothetical protein